MALFASGKCIWKAAAAGALLAVVALGGLVVAGKIRQGKGAAAASAGHGPAAPALKPDHGIIVFQSRFDGFWQICSLDLSSGARTRLTRSHADDVHPCVSPDGAWIAFESNRSGSVAVWRMRADGTGSEQLTAAGNECLDPCWSRDGRQVLYSSRRSGGEHIFILELATGHERQLTDSFWRSILPDISPDGAAIAFTRNKLGWDVYRMNSDGSGIRALTAQGGNCRPDWSPDGKRIAYVSDVADGKGDVWTMAGDGNDKLRVTADDGSYDYNPAWSPDGRWIVYETTRGSKSNPWSLAILPAGGGTPAILTPTGADDRFPDWAPGKDAR